MSRALTLAAAVALFVRPAAAQEAAAYTDAQRAARTIAESLLRELPVGPRPRVVAIAPLDEPRGPCTTGTLIHRALTASLAADDRVVLFNPQEAQEALPTLDPSLLANQGLRDQLRERFGDSLIIAGVVIRQGAVDHVSYRLFAVDRGEVVGTGDADLARSAVVCAPTAAPSAPPPRPPAPPPARPAPPAPAPPLPGPPRPAPAPAPTPAPATIAVYCEPSTLSLEIDGVERDDLGNYRMIRVAPGPHTVRAFQRGYVEHRQFVSVSEGGRVEVRFALPHEDEPPPAPPPAASTRPSTTYTPPAYTPTPIASVVVARRSDSVFSLLFTGHIGTRLGYEGEGGVGVFGGQVEYDLAATRARGSFSLGVGVDISFGQGGVLAAPLARVRHAFGRANGLAVFADTAAGIVFPLTDGDDRSRLGLAVGGGLSYLWGASWNGVSAFARAFLVANESIYLVLGVQGTFDLNDR